MGEFSKEFCGGTHVNNTGVITAFKIVSEAGIAAGVRRIEALTGNAVFEYYKSIEEKLSEVCKLVKATPANVNDKINHLLAELKTLSSENESLKSKAATSALGNVMDKVIDVEGVKFLAAAIPGVEMNELRNLGDDLKTKLGEGVVVLASAMAEDKVNLIAMATEGAIAKGAHAGNIIKEVAKVVGGGGGGRPNMAQAGGKIASKIDEAIEMAKTTLAGQLG